MVTTNQLLRRNILSLHDLHVDWNAYKISQELYRSDNPPTQKRNTLLKLIRRTIKRGTVEYKKPCGRPRSVRIPQYQKKVRKYCYNKRKKSIRKTNTRLKSLGMKSS